MPKRLLILRHAKSDWNDASLPDHERPLNERGKSEAPKVGKTLRQSGRVPDLIISSTARRARKTAQKVAEACHYEERVLLFPELYNATPETILHVVRGVAGDPQTLMVVGHNPGVEAITSRFAGKPVAMPTASLADLEIEISAWSELSLTSPAKLTELSTVKDEDVALGGADGN